MYRSAVSRRDAMKAGAAAALGLAIGRTDAAAQGGQLPLITKPIPSTGERLPVIGLGTTPIASLPPT